MAHMSRRTLIQSTLACAACGPVLARDASAAAPSLEARPARAQLAPADYPQTSIWSYDGGLPGPELRLRQGARLRRTLVNGLPQPTSVHWHGIRIANAMDGVTYLTQDPVAPGDRFLYDFEVPDAGTYWYHPHHRTYEQMARGLYGALVVEEADDAPETDADLVLLLDDWRLTADAQIAGGFENLHDRAHAGRIGNWITVNGRGAFSRPVQRHARLRLRLVNAANARVFDLSARGLDGWTIALDGMPLDSPQPFERIRLAPAQRVDLLVDVVTADAGEALLVSHERDGAYALAGFPVAPGANVRRAPPRPLPLNRVPALGKLSDARQVALHMEGGAHGGLAQALLAGEMRDARSLAAAGKVWAFNGHADMPKAPLLTASAGETVRVRMHNDTAWPHAMHLHGHHFRQIHGTDTVGPLRDTLLMAPRTTVEIAFVADNPGDWLLHCHMLEHAASGMMTWLRVT